MKLAKILIFMVVAVLPFLVDGRGKKDRLGCASNLDCLTSCGRTCSNFLRPLCYNSQCYCQALGQGLGQGLGQRLGYPSTNYRRGSPGEPEELLDYDIKIK
nr:uncharacterized protein LOC117986870 [Maniola hyperantus]